MSYDSEATEVDNESGNGPSEKDQPPPFPSTLNNDIPKDNVNDSGKDPSKKDPPPPISQTLNNDVPQEVVNDSGKGSGEKGPSSSEILLDSDDNSYDSNHLKNLSDQIKRHELIASKDPDKHAIELKKLKIAYKNAAKQKKIYEKKRKDRQTITSNTQRRRSSRVQDGILQYWTEYKDGKKEI